MATQLQKVLLLPPMRGLNLYENPFTMDSQFAEQLINYMPPTTELKVRPGVRKLLDLYGAIRGMYSYAVGTATTYGASWSDQTIKEGERSTLILKLSQNSGKTMIYSLNPISLDYDTITETDDNQYSKDACYFKHYIFMSSGAKNLPMYLWSSRTGYSSMYWRVGESALSTKQISDLENLTFYNGKLYANAYKTLDVYFAAEEDVDPSGDDNWDNLFAWFYPTGQGQLSLDGIVKKGGSIIKIINLSRTGMDTIGSYLCVCTDQGEIVVFEGTDPAEQGQWAVKGRFEIPIPLNKNCFCAMEGDVIVGTYNGLFSLNRVIFGQQTEITQSIETRILNVFQNSMLQESVFNQFLGLFYYPKERLLIFNVPTQMPLPLNRVKRGYTFTPECYITLPAGMTSPIDPTETSLLTNQLASFISSYIYYSWINYSIVIQFNGTEASDREGIFLEIVSDPGEKDLDGKIPCSTTVSFYVRVFDASINAIKETQFCTPLIFKTDNMLSAAPKVELDNRLDWNPELLKTYGTLKYYGYDFPKFDDKAEWVITDIVPRSEKFMYLQTTRFGDEMYEGFSLSDAKSITVTNRPDSKNSPYVVEMPVFFNKLMSKPPHDVMGQSGNTHAFFMEDAGFNGYTDKGDWQYHNVYMGTIYNWMRGEYPNYPDIKHPLAEYIGRLDWFSWQDAYRSDANFYNAWPASTMTWTYQVLLSDKNANSCSFETVWTFLHTGKKSDYDSYALDDWTGSRLTVEAHTYFTDTAGVKTEIPFEIWTGSRWNALFYFRLIVLKTPFPNAKNKVCRVCMDLGWNSNYVSDIAEGYPLATLTAGQEWSVHTVKTFSNLVDYHKVDSYPETLHPENYKALFDNVFPTAEYTKTDIRAFAAQWGYLLDFIKINVDEGGVVPPPVPPPVPSDDVFAYLDQVYSGQDLNVNVGNLVLAFTPQPKDVYNPLIVDYPNFVKDNAQRFKNAFGAQSSISVEGWAANYDSDEHTQFSIMRELVVRTAEAMKLGYFEQALSSTQYYTTYVLSNGTDQIIIRLRIFLSAIFNTSDGSLTVQAFHQIRVNDVNPIIIPGSPAATMEATFVIHEGGELVSLVNMVEPTSVSISTDTYSLSSSSDPNSHWKVASISSDGWHSGGNPNYQWMGLLGQTIKAFNEVRSDQVEEFARYWGYLYCFAVFKEDRSTPERKFVEKPREELKLKDLKPKEAEYSPIFAVQNANFDLGSVPMLEGVNIVSPYRSTQYVMNSYYGTWSQWTDVNMVDGITHQNDFYFIVPKDVNSRIKVGEFSYNQSMLCKFDQDANGDFEDMDDPLAAQPIKTTYQIASSNQQVNQLKQLLRFKIYGTASTFWGGNANSLRFTFLSDFQENPTYYYQHTTWQSSIPGMLMRSKKYGDWTRQSLRKLVRMHRGKEVWEAMKTDEDILKSMNKYVIKDFNSSLTYSHLKDYKATYITESSMIKNIEMGVIGRPANRIGLKVEMDITEHNIVIYGYELYFKLLQKL